MWEGRVLEGEWGREDPEVPCFLSMKNPAFSEMEAAFTRALALLFYLSQLVGNNPNGEMLEKVYLQQEFTLNEPNKEKTDIAEGSDVDGNVGDVQKIVMMRHEKGKPQYKVKWKGFKKESLVDTSKTNCEDFLGTFQGQE